MAAVSSPTAFLFLRSAWGHILSTLRVCHAGDAERPVARSHAERRNEENSKVKITDYTDRHGWLHGASQSSA